MSGADLRREPPVLSQTSAVCALGSGRFALTLWKAARLSSYSPTERLYQLGSSLISFLQPRITFAGWIEIVENHVEVRLPFAGVVDLRSVLKSDSCPINIVVLKRNDTAPEGNCDYTRSNGLLKSYISGLEKSLASMFTNNILYICVLILLTLALLSALIACSVQLRRDCLRRRWKKQTPEYPQAVVVLPTGQQVHIQY